MADVLRLIRGTLAMSSLVLLLAPGLPGCRSSADQASDTAQWLQQGDALSRAAFDTLRTSLMQAIATLGLPGAVPYCHQHAATLTASAAPEGVIISRVSPLYRNPDNAADSLDQATWQHFQQLKTQGDSLVPLVVTHDDRAIYYKPILLQPMCTPCHGQPGTDIPEAVMAAIRDKYPNDKAIGFRPGDLRGLWKISFPKKP
ncbi:MAG: DUF3365 domain-containing protein [Chitinophagaceae bacterium]|nr:DUF3365 domain-containing protein [Chitinophagaceae bacterium]